VIAGRRGCRRRHERPMVVWVSWSEGGMSEGGTNDGEGHERWGEDTKDVDEGHKRAGGREGEDISQIEWHWEDQDILTPIPNGERSVRRQFWNEISVRVVILSGVADCPSVTPWMVCDGNYIASCGVTVDVWTISYLPQSLNISRVCGFYRMYYCNSLSVQTHFLYRYTAFCVQQNPSSSLHQRNGDKEISSPLGLRSLHWKSGRPCTTLSGFIRHLSTTRFTVTVTIVCQWPLINRQFRLELERAAIGCSGALSLWC
jgi:hypothetical protein